MHREDLLPTVVGGLKEDRGDAVVRVVAVRRQYAQHGVRELSRLEARHQHVADRADLRVYPVNGILRLRAESGKCRRGQRENQLLHGFLLSDSK